MTPKRLASRQSGFVTLPWIFYAIVAATLAVFFKR